MKTVLTQLSNERPEDRHPLTGEGELQSYEKEQS